jgi:hypothetical protein
MLAVQKESILEPNYFAFKTIFIYGDQRGRSPLFKGCKLKCTWNLDHHLSALSLENLSLSL